MQKTSIGKYLIVLVVSLFMTQVASAQKFSPSSYIAEHKEIAQQLMSETGVPASVILAIAIHESAYGNSRVASHLNNHFGIKGKNNSKVIRSAYKGYTSVKESYLDFIGLLKRRKATNGLFEEHSSDDYRAWVKGVAGSGYSTSKDWSSKVLATINRYNLDDFDAPNAQNKTNLALAANKSQDLLLNSMESSKKVSEVFVASRHVVKKGDTLSAIAMKHKTTVNAIKRKNNLASSKLSIGQRLVL